jgi:hypothetical protein
VTRTIRSRFVFFGRILKHWQSDDNLGDATVKLMFRVARVKQRVAHHPERSEVPGEHHGMKPFPVSISSIGQAGFELLRKRVLTA